MDVDLLFPATNTLPVLTSGVGSLSVNVLIVLPTAPLNAPPAKAILAFNCVWIADVTPSV